VPAAETAPSFPDARDDLLEATYSKVFLRIVPFLMVLWVIAWIDRVNVGFAKLQMLHDLNFSEAVYGLGAGIFFLGYFLFEVPSNLLMNENRGEEDHCPHHAWLGLDLDGDGLRKDVAALAEALAHVGIELGRFLPLEPGQQWDCPRPDQPPRASETFTTGG
jgi:hypothetical protein